MDEEELRCVICGCLLSGEEPQQGLCTKHQYDESEEVDD